MIYLIKALVLGKSLLPKFLFLVLSLPGSDRVDGEIVKVGLEYMPPLVINRNEGMTIDFLREIEARSNLQFDIVIMPYNRAKAQLASGHIQLLGHTPYQLEQRDFYQFAHELQWHLQARVDLYTLSQPTSRELVNIAMTRIGTPRGNAEFLAERFQLSTDHFIQAELLQLVKMLVNDRLDAIVFERASTMTTIVQLGVKEIYYRQIDDSIAVGLAVSNSDFGRQFGARLDDIILDIDQSLVYSNFFEFTGLPRQGRVTPIGETLSATSCSDSQSGCQSRRPACEFFDPTLQALAATTVN